MPEINYIAVIIAGLLSMVLGGIWYGPLFGTMWVRGMGWDPNDKKQMEKMKASAGPAYAQQLVGALLMAFVFAHVLWAFRVAAPMPPFAAGIQGAFWMWLGFVLPVKYGDKLWGGKAFKYVAVDLGYYLVLLIAMGLVLSFWR